MKTPDKKPLPLTELTAISPIDGRYGGKTKELRPYLSEHGLVAERVRVEVEYLIALSQARKYQKVPDAKVPDFSFTGNQISRLRSIYKKFSVGDTQWIKDTEKTTNHDVKAVEYFVKEKLEKLGLGDMAEWVHFGLTSQDINNTATPITMKVSLEEVMIPHYEKVIGAIRNMATMYKDIPMLARTHGQPATPTNLGKEMMVFVERLEEQFSKLRAYRFQGKFGGATGNFNAHHIAYPDIDWMEFADSFLQKSLRLKRQQYTTQIAHYDEIGELYHIMERINTILIDFSRDIWQYISMEFFKQKTKPGEIGSSAMPHKVNPIDFENAEGNLGLANVMGHHFATKLPISRLQRDLTDSTVLRNVGLAFGFTLIALKSLSAGIGKLEVNEGAILTELDEHPLVISEAIQTVLRSIGYPGAYEALKGLTRGNTHLTLEDIYDFTDRLEGVPDDIKTRLRTITPRNYTGIFPEIAQVKAV